MTTAATGGSPTAVLLSDGRIYTWAYNYFGQLGDTSTTNRNTPTLATRPLRATARHQA